MSIVSQLNRVATNVSDTLSAINEMGGTLPANATSDDMAAGVRSISTGAGIDDTTVSTTKTYSSSKIEARFAEIGTQEEIVQQVIAALGTPVFGTVDENNNIILTGGLTNGTYTLKYEDADGEVTEIGTLTYSGGSYEIELVWNAKTNINNDNTAIAYGELTTDDNYATSEPVNLESGKRYTLTARNKAGSGTSCHLYYFNANGGALGEVTGFKNSDGDGDIVLAPPAGAASVRLYGYVSGGGTSSFENIYTLSAVNDASAVLTETFEIKWNNGDKLDKTTGAVASTGDSKYAASDFIELDTSKTYTLNMCLGVTGTSPQIGVSIIYYNANNSFVQYAADVMYSNESPRSHVLSIPANATKIRLRAYDATYTFDWLDQLYFTAG